MHYSYVQSDVQEIARRCGRNPQEITLVAVSKGCSKEEVRQAYEAGGRDFGENRLVEALPKMAQSPQDIHWHLVGTLQKNKVRKAIGKFVLIHSVDSVELARKISQCSQEQKLLTSVLLQVNVSGEKTKHGMNPEGWLRIFQEVWTLPGICIKGLMTIAPLVEDEGVIRDSFRGLRLLRDELAEEVGGVEALPELSMGMSHDYPIAIQEGATLLRIGTAIFHPHFIEG
jgi:pyridoxal phosphate enzyme (YggS family)